MPTGKLEKQQLGSQLDRNPSLVDVSTTGSIEQTLDGLDALTTDSEQEPREFAEPVVLPVRHLRRNRSRTLTLVELAILTSTSLLLLITLQAAMRWRDAMQSSHSRKKEVLQITPENK